MTYNQLKEAAIQHNEGRPMQAIARDYGVHVNTLAKAMKKCGIEYKARRGKEEGKADMEKIKKGLLQQGEEKTARPKDWGLIIVGDIESGKDCAVIETGPKQAWSVTKTNDRIQMTRGAVTVFMSPEEYARRFDEE